jgi:alpha-methylacyl-CoA racemase
LGPLNGLKVIEMCGLGPGPFCGMLLADMGADVLRIERAVHGASAMISEMDPKKDFMARGRRSVIVDFKNPATAAFVLDLIEKAEILFEALRPGAMERMGLAPDVCLARNPRLVYGRMTGWGQTGPYAQRAGHDINFIGLSGALWSIGRKGDKPVPPLVLAGNFSGGGMMLALGLMAAVINARETGLGQIIDASIVEGSSLMMTMQHALREMGVVREERGVNLHDTGAHFWEVYETADGRYMAVGAPGPQFYAKLGEGLGLDSERFAKRRREDWPALKIEVEQVFKTKTQAEWCAIFDELDASVSPVLSPTEAIQDPHNVARQSFIEVGGFVQPAPAPRFSRTPSSVSRPPPAPGEGATEVLKEWGLDEARIESARTAGIIG